MLITRFLQILLGYVNFEADGGNPEKFLNLSARASVTMWNLRRKGTVLCGSTLRSNYKKLLPQAEKAGVRLYITEKKGVPVVFERHRGRWGFLAGVVFFFVIIAYFSGFVWSVEISGNKMVTTREIQYALGDLGLSPGVRIDTFNKKSLEQQALIKLPGLSWMHINLDGSVAMVEVGERARRPEIVPEDRPCNIKASTTGQIISMQINQGVAALKKNDVVQTGELLVSGVVEEPKSGVTRYLHARAKVIARTKHEFSVKVPFKTTEMRDTGKIIRNYKLNFLSLRIPLYFTEPRGSFRRMCYKNPLKIFGTELPVSLSTAAFYEYHRVPVTLTKRQALNKAKVQLLQKEKTELSGVSIKKKSYVRTVSSDGLILTGRYTCEEDIALSQEITVAQEIAGSQETMPKAK